MSTVISVRNLSKSYRLGLIGAQTLRDDAARWWARLRGRPDPLLKVGQNDLRSDSNTESIWALRDVSFEVKQGEVLGIIGKNGAGKSTLLKILSRITAPTSGEVRVKGRLASLLEVGTGFHHELTGRANIYLNGAILGMSRAEVGKKYDEIVAFSEVEKFIDTPVKRYSSGMYVRLAFAVAAHLEPEILLVDEVLAVGDAAFQKKCLGKMGDVARGGRTILFVSHNLTAVKSLCNRVLWLDKGGVAKSGDAGLVVSEYLQSGAASVLKQVWTDPATAPGNEKVRIRSAEVSPLVDGPGGDITVETPLLVKFEFWNYLADALLNVTLHLFTIDGTCVLAVGSGSTPRKQGMVREAVKIPGHFLNDGAYAVTLQVVQDGSSTVYLHREILVFEVHDSPRSGSWFGKWPGVIRPKLEWDSHNEELAKPKPS